MNYDILWIQRDTEAVQDEQDLASQNFMLIDKPIVVLDLRSWWLKYIYVPHYVCVRRIKSPWNYMYFLEK